MRILLVDDDAEVRTVTAAYLADMGHRVVEAADGSSALDILKTDDQLDLLIADFAMPGMTGTDLADKVRAVRPEIGILLVTGYADPKRDAGRISYAAQALQPHRSGGEGHRGGPLSAELRRSRSKVRMPALHGSPAPFERLYA